MRTRKFRKPLILLLLLAAFVLAHSVNANSPKDLNAADPLVLFSQNRQIHEPELLVLSSNKSSLTVQISFSGFEQSAILLNNETWNAVSFPGNGKMSIQGIPDLPVYRKLFAMPSTTGLAVQITDLETVTVKTPPIAPIQKFLLETESELDAPFAMDASLYATDEFFPADWAVTSIVGIMHGVRMGQIEVRPLRYNPVSGELLAVRSIKITIDFVGTNQKNALPYKSGTVPRHLFRTFQSHLINSNSLGIQDSGKSTAADYLIIADENLAGAQSLADLVAFHESQGKVVLVVSTATTGTTADEIKAVIQAEYDSITPPELDYILLVADVDVIPLKIDAIETYNGASWVDSDQWYAWLEGDDIFSDAALGRFPATDIAELDAMVTKTLNFHNEVAPGAWLSKSVLIANGEYYPGKYTECKQSIFDYEFDLDAPVMDMLFGGDPTVAPTNDDIMDAIEDGRVVVNYRGHGSEAVWWKWNLDEQNYSTSHVRTLQNGEKTPIIFSIACLNANMMESTSETLGEAFLRHDQGAVAFLGAIHPSYTYPNHDFDRSLYFAAWDQGIAPIGDLLNWANIDLFNTYCSDEPCVAQDNIAMYLWLGDPTIEVPIYGLLSPADLVAQALSTSEIRLSWTDRTDDEDGFIIERADATDTYVEVADLPPNTITWTDSGLANCDYFTYRMRTYKGAEFSRYTREVPMQTLGLPPTNLTAVSSATDSIQLQWDDVTSGELGFHVYKKGPADPVFTKLLVTEANMAGTLDDGLTEGAVYQYKVTTFTLGGESTFVGPASAITLPAAPQNLAAQPQSDLSVTLTWTDESQGEQGVRIYRSAHLENAFAQIGRVPEGGITYADTAAQEATEYDYYVAGYNASGQGPQTPAIFVTSVPAAPLALNARPVSTSQIHLTWTDNSAAEDGYRLERDLKSEVSVLAQVPAGSTRYSDTGYAEGALVSYQLYAFNAAGDSIATPLVETMTMPNTPTNLQALVGQDGVVALSWTDKSRTEDGYKIFRKTEAGEFQSIGTVGPNETTFEDATLDLSQPAIYQVCAYNPFTNSEFSNTAGVPPEEENDDDSGDDDEAGNGKSSDKNESDSGSGCGC